MQASSIVPACEADVNPQASGVSNIPVSRPHDSSTRQPPVIIQEVYVPCPPIYTATSAAACADLDSIAAVLCGQWEHLRPHQAAQLVERALENCRPFVPSELHSTLDTICDVAAHIRTSRGRVSGLSGPCSSCGYYECSYCGNCHNPSCSAYTPTCSRSMEVTA